MTLADLERQVREILASELSEDEARLEARHLMMAALSLQLTDLLVHSHREVTAEDQMRVVEWANRRQEDYPLAYLSGRRGFYKFDFEVRPGVLVPRPETELVLEVTLARRNRKVLRFADLGSGSGCLGLSLAHELEGAELFAVDASPVANEVTLRNSHLLGLAERTHVISSRVEEWTTAPQFQLIVANPPYIAEGDREVQSGVHRFEPHLALYSGIEGLDAIRSWVPWAFAHLDAGGLTAFEIGSRQSASVQEIMRLNGFTQIEVAKDGAGHDRVVSALKPK